jgi:hypothetical protein
LLRILRGSPRKCSLWCQVWQGYLLIKGWPFLHFGQAFSLSEISFPSLHSPSTTRSTLRPRPRYHPILLCPQLSQRTLRCFLSITSMEGHIHLFFWEAPAAPLQLSCARRQQVQDKPSWTTEWPRTESYHQCKKDVCLPVSIRSVSLKQFPCQKAEMR